MRRMLKDATIATMTIFINVKFPVKPDLANEWPARVQWYTEATRAEEGNVWFDWYRSEDDPTVYLCCEGFKEGADVAHVQSDHFKRAMSEWPAMLARTPEIINTNIDGTWGPMGELRVN